jgi:hypothetical protein
MDNLSTVSIDISSQIGALELGGYVEGCGDDALESAGAYLNPPPQPTQVRTGCGLPLTLACRISDDALEAAGANVALGGPPTAFPICGMPVTAYPPCPRIGDDMLLRAAETTMSGPPPTAHSGGCTILRGSCATDGMLEAALASGPPATMVSCVPPTLPFCR